VARLNIVLIKTVRVTSWPLLGLMVLYLVTGYALCGQTAIGRWMSVDTALMVHKLFDWPLVTLFVGHSLPAVYLAFVRWGWIRKRNKA